MSIISDLASGATGGLLGGVGQLAKDIREAITGDIPAEKKAEIEQHLLDLENQAMNAQAQINLEEAKSEHGFTRNWRPAIGWIGGIGLLYAAFLEPLFRFIAQVGFAYKGPFPVIDTTLTSQVLIGILGLGAFRSYDKKQAPAPAGKE